MMLSARLSAVARHVLPGQPVADVGTDHGKLPVSLLLSGQVPRAIASDRRPDPLRGARSLAAQHRLTAPVFEARLSDGLAHLQPGEAATVTICGMGGGLMASILAANPPLPQGVSRLVLQPNNAPGRTRQQLAADGWAIVDEEMIAEGGYFYPVLVAEPGTMALTEAEALLGPVLLQKRPAAFVAWLASESARLAPLVARAQAAAQQAQGASLRKLVRRQQLIAEALA